MQGGLGEVEVWFGYEFEVLPKSLVRLEMVMELKA